MFYSIKYMKQILIAVSILPMFVSCDKTTPDNDYTITAVVVDIDTRTTIPGAKVYSQVFPRAFGSLQVYDSAFSDASGKAVFTHQKGERRSVIAISKIGYVPTGAILYSISPNFVDRTDSVYLGRGSYVNLTVHRTGTYLPGDSVHVKVKGNYNRDGIPGHFWTVVKDLAITPDKVLNLEAIYHPFYNPKLNFECDIRRAGLVLTTISDSTDMIQYSTKSYTLNY